MSVNLPACSDLALQRVRDLELPGSALGGWAGGALLALLAPLTGEEHAATLGRIWRPDGDGAGWAHLGDSLRGRRLAALHHLWEAQEPAVLALVGDALPDVADAARSLLSELVGLEDGAPSEWVLRGSADPLCIVRAAAEAIPDLRRWQQLWTLEEACARTEDAAPAAPGASTPAPEAGPAAPPEPTAPHDPLGRLTDDQKALYRALPCVGASFNDEGGDLRDSGALKGEMALTRLSGAWRHYPARTASRTYRRLADALRQHNGRDLLLRRRGWYARLELDGANGTS